MCKACDRCKTVELVTGKAVCSYCPRWAHECLSRYKSALVVLDIGTVSGRQSWLASYEKEHGPAAAERLRNTVKRMWGER